MAEINKNSPHKSMLEHLNELYQLFDNKTISQAHYLYLAIHVIALYTGFVPQSDHINKRIQLFRLQPWSTFDKRNVEVLCKQKPTYEYNLPHETYFTEKLITLVEKEQDDNLKSVLTAIVTGDFMILTLTPHSSSGLLGRSTCLSIGRYVISNSESEQSIEGCYQKLDQLMIQLRNEVFMPVRTDQLFLIDAYPQPSLMGIPQELRFRIYAYLKHRNERAKLKLLNKEIFEEISKMKKKQM